MGEALPMKRRTVDRKALRRRELIDAALTVFARDGFAGATIDAVAEEAEVSKGTVYLYFESKEALFEEVVRGRLLSVIGAARSFVTTFEGPVEALLRAQVTFLYEKVAGSDQQVILRLMLSEGPSFPALSRFYYDEVIKALVNALSMTLERGAREGVFRPVPAADAARVILGPTLLAGVWQVLLSRRDRLDVEGLLDTQMRMLVAALAPRP